MLRFDNERALPAFLRAAAAGLEGVEGIDQASPEGESRSEWTRRGWCARSQSTDSSAEESVGRKTQETAGLE